MLLTLTNDSNLRCWEVLRVIRPRASMFVLAVAHLVAGSAAAQEKQDLPQPGPPANSANADQTAPRAVSRRQSMADLGRRTWTVDGIERSALLYIPSAANSTPAPLVFAFHGHGGTMQNAANSFAIHRLWPEAIAVYMQGLNTPGGLTDPEGKKSGWQNVSGAQADRDLKFFDAVLAALRADYKVDDHRIYATGHSNGGGFTYVLWSSRGDVFAALAPSSAAGPGAGWISRTRSLSPKPVLHLAGEQDALVKFDWQKRRIDELRKINGCESTGKEWGKWCTQYASPSGTPVVTMIHPGGHRFPDEAPPLFVKFFQEHTKP